METGDWDMPLTNLVAKWALRSGIKRNLGELGAYLEIAINEFRCRHEGTLMGKENPGAIHHELREIPKDKHCWVRFSR